MERPRGSAGQGSVSPSAGDSAAVLGRFCLGLGVETTKTLIFIKAKSVDNFSEWRQMEVRICGFVAHCCFSVQRQLSYLFHWILPYAVSVVTSLPAPSNLFGSCQSTPMILEEGLTPFMLHNPT